MSTYTIYHNPRCSKSRATLALLEDKAITPEIKLYLQHPPTHDELQTVLQKLGITARELLRTGEAIYKELGLANTALSENDIVQAMISHPKLIERPIVIKGDKAIIGRPPENITLL
jgi:arsenate reductase (glutaredoxin)